MNLKELYSFLEEKHECYNRPDFIGSDPISIPHLFSRKQDIEISGFLTATIAWGQRVTILKNANELMRRMDFSPYDFILNHTRRDLTRFRNFRHRTFNPTDLKFFFFALTQIYRNHDSLESAFSGDSARLSILNFGKKFFSDRHLRRTRKHVSCPPMNAGGTGSACKRLNMFLRWMVRKDGKGVDFGIWKNLTPADLMCPLDVHSANVARKLGLLERKQNDWRAVEELTSRLREFDPDDPVKYDFALFGLGVFEKF